ncbi:MAG: ABC transporter permease [Gemmatimonadetes bacterium]|nr:ABC transporter permease [Gemmatimonadota bacterium]
MIGLLQATVFRRLPWAAPEQLFALILRDNNVPRQWTEREATAARDGAVPRIAITWYATSEEKIVESRDSSIADVALVEPQFFGVLGLSALEGRLPRTQEEEDVVVLSSRLREELFPSTTAVGQYITVGDRKLAVVGVMPNGSEYPLGVDAWRLGRSRFEGVGGRTVDLIVRDSAGRSAEEIERLFEGVAAAVASAPSDPGVRTSTQATSLAEHFRPRIGRRVRVILVGIAAVVVLVLVNVSSAMMLRAERNLFANALRVTLGAPFSRLARHASLEILLLVAFSLLVGLGLAAASTGAMRALLGGPFADAHVSFDLTWLLALGVALLLITGALALAPLLALNRIEPAVALRMSGSAGSPGASRLRRLFLGLQVGTTLFFLLIAAAIGMAFAEVSRIDLGYAHREVSFATIGLGAEEFQDPARVRAIAGDVAERARQSLNASAVAVWGTTYPHRLALQTESPIQIPERVLPAQDPMVLPVLSVDVNQEYFNVMGISLRKGRVFDSSDSEGSDPVVILDERAARALWGDEEPIGKSLRLGGRASTLPWMTVVGIVASSQPVHPLALEWELEGTRFPLMYRPLSQSAPAALLAPLSNSGFSIAVASNGTPARAARVFEQIIAEVAPGERPEFNGPLSAFVDRKGRLEEARFEALVLGLFGVLGALLALLAVATAVDETLHARTREIGIRRALGSPAHMIIWRVCLDTLRVAAAGIVVAMVGFVLSGPAMQFLLREDSHATAATVAQAPVWLVFAVAGLIGSLALAIAYWRASRAAQVEPSIALRAN